MSNNPINFRPNDEDLRILDAIKVHLTKHTKLETYYNAAIRHALYDWRDNHYMPMDEEEK